MDIRFNLGVVTVLKRLFYSLTTRMKKERGKCGRIFLDPKDRVYDPRIRRKIKVYARGKS